MVLMRPILCRMNACTDCSLEYMPAVLGAMAVYRTQGEGGGEGKETLDVTADPHWLIGAPLALGGMNHVQHVCGTAAHLHNSSLGYIQHRLGGCRRGLCAAIQNLQKAADSGCQCSDLLHQFLHPR